jgi:hypothetical protein
MKSGKKKGAPLTPDAISVVAMRIAMGNINQHCRLIRQLLTSTTYQRISRENEGSS